MLQLEEGQEKTIHLASLTKNIGALAKGQKVAVIRRDVDSGRGIITKSVSIDGPSKLVFLETGLPHTGTHVVLTTSAKVSYDQLTELTHFADSSGEMWIDAACGARELLQDG